MRDRQKERQSTRSTEINLAPSQGVAVRRRSNRVAAVNDCFSSCFDKAEIGLSITDLAGRLLEVNSAFSAITGYNESELLTSLHRQTLVHPSDLLLEQEQTRALIAGDIPAFVVEQRYVKKDGSIIWVQHSVSLVHDEAGNPAKLARLTQDITRRKLAEASLRDIEEQRRARDLLKPSEGALEAERALRESEERYRDLVENSHELICTHDLDGTILSVNRAARELFGYELHEFVGRKSIQDILASRVRGQFDEYMRRILTEGGTSGTMLVETRSGEHRLLEYYNSLRTEGVAAPIVRGIARDITEKRRAERALRESEERYRELFENSKDAFYVRDMNGVYVSVNRAVEKLSGYRREEIIGKHFSQFMTPEYARQVQRQLQKKLDSAGETTYEIEMITKKGKHVPVEISSRLIFENGVAVGVQGCVRDISDRKKAQEATRNYSRRLIEAQEAERRRISRELHDQVGQILTAVKMNLHALQHSCSEAEILSSIADNLKAIDEAVDQVRDLSVDLRPLLLDDLGLVVALRWYLERQTRNCGVPAKFVSGSLDEDDRFSSELETACFRIVQEGVTNIVRHARASRISVRLERVLSDLILLITDDGAGFDARLLRSGNAGSATLGLRGMEERAQAVGGTITIDSAPALGTEICARLPIKGEKRRDSESARAVEFAKA